jgi:hypothetical protein
VSTAARIALLLVMAWSTRLPAASLQPLRPDALPVPAVLDLHYGDVLFQYYTDQHFEALVRLEAYGAWQRLPSQGADASLLAGGLYLSLGAHSEAARRFEALLSTSAPPRVADRAWFHLARARYARGLPNETVAALEHIRMPLAGDAQAQRIQLHANALMQLGRYDDAALLLQGNPGADDWSAYARYNLGVALVRANRLAEAATLLEELGKAPARSEEMRALRDRANLALGFARLQAGQPADALSPLQRVRLEGPSANTALLGLGWAQVAINDPREALKPWLELRSRTVLDSAVQEAQLAVPFAYARLGAGSQAIEAYEQALQSYDEEAVRIDEAVGRIRSGGLFTGLGGIRTPTDTDKGWLWQLRQMPATPEARYLAPLLAGTGFQQGLQNLRDLADHGRVLSRWQDDMAIHADMLVARDAALARQLPRVDALRDATAVTQLEERRANLMARVAEADARGDVASLGTPEQQQQWTRIQRAEARLEELPEDAAVQSLREKLQLAKGVLLWNLQRDERQRRFARSRELQRIDAGLDEAQNRLLRVQRAADGAPARTAGFAERMQQLRTRLADLQGQLETVARRQERVLADSAIEALQAQRERLDEYRQQARFELAAAQDRDAVPEVRP